MHINIDESAGAQVMTSGELSYNIAKGQGIDAHFSDIGQNLKLILTGNSSHLKTEYTIKNLIFLPGSMIRIFHLLKNKKNRLESVGMASGSMQTVECCHGPERIPTDRKQ